MKEEFEKNRERLSKGMTVPHGYFQNLETIILQKTVDVNQNSYKVSFIRSPRALWMGAAAAVLVLLMVWFIIPVQQEATMDYDSSFVYMIENIEEFDLSLLELLMEEERETWIWHDGMPAEMDTAEKRALLNWLKEI